MKIKIAVHNEKQKICSFSAYLIWLSRKYVSIFATRKQSNVLKQTVGVVEIS